MSRDTQTQETPLRLNDIQTEGPQLWEREMIFLEASEAVFKVMEEQNVSQSKLAAKLGHTKGRISQVLSGRNITLATLADLMQAMGQRVKIITEPINKSETSNE